MVRQAHHERDLSFELFHEVWKEKSNGRNEHKKRYFTEISDQEGNDTTKYGIHGDAAGYALNNEYVKTDWRSYQTNFACACNEDAEDYRVKTKFCRQRKEDRRDE